MTNRAQEAPLNIRIPILFTLLLALVATSAAQPQARISVETSQGLFSVLAGINACGYDTGLSESIPLREQIRGEVLKAAQTEAAQNALRNMCGFYEDHMQDTASRTLSNYISLGLNLEDNGKIELRTKEANLPPDAVFVLGFVPLLQKFSQAADLNAVWLRHRRDYDDLVHQMHKPVSDTLLSTDIYLKRNLSSYYQHNFVIYLDPLAAPNEVNSRNYADDYFMAISPSASAPLPLDQIRHTYLHYILDSKLLNRAKTLDRLAPLLEAVKPSALDESYRFDISLLTTESLIKAIEARQAGGRKGPEQPKEQAAWLATRQGFILTMYFYKQLQTFESDEIGFDQAYANWLHEINVEEETRLAAKVPFVQNSTNELVRRTQHKELLVELAERALASGNFDGARNYARQAIDNKEDQGRAFFVLARVSVADGKLAEAQEAFERAASVSNDAKIRGWSHLYLGRIFDMQERRQDAVAQYRAAMEGDASPGLKAAAEKGLQQAYRTPSRHTGTSTSDDTKE